MKILFSVRLTLDVKPADFKGLTVFIKKKKSEYKSIHTVQTILFRVNCTGLSIYLVTTEVSNRC